MTVSKTDTILEVHEKDELPKGSATFQKVMDEIAAEKAVELSDSEKSTDDESHSEPTTGGKRTKALWKTAKNKYGLRPNLYRVVMLNSMKWKLPVH